MSDYTERGNVFWESLSTPELQRRIVAGQTELDERKAFCAVQAKVIGNLEDSQTAMKAIVARRFKDDDHKPTYLYS